MYTWYINTSKLGILVYTCILGILVYTCILGYTAQNTWVPHLVGTWLVLHPVGITHTLVTYDKVSDVVES